MEPEVSECYDNDTDQLIQQNHEDNTLFKSSPAVKVFKQRWYILLAFSFFAALQSGIWNTWSSLGDSVKFAFGWTDATIALLGNWGPITYVITAFVFSWLTGIKGLRLTLVLSCFLMWIGTGLRCITSEQPAVTWLMHAGQLFNGVAGPIAMAAPTLISSLWFPTRQRSFATGIMLSAMSLAIAISFIVGPLLVPQVSDEVMDECSHPSQSNYSESRNDSESFCDKKRSEVKTDIMQLMYIEFGMTTVCLLMILIYFPSKPSVPPSLSASVPRIDFVQGVKHLFRLPQFWALAIGYSVQNGVNGGWGVVLGVNLSPVGVSEENVGWIGFSGSIAGIIGCLGSSVCASLFLRRMRFMLLLFFSITTIAYTFFAIVCQQWFPIPVLPSLYASQIVGSMFMWAASPLFYELSVESAYPVHEGLTNMVTTWLINFFALLFLLVLMIPNIGTAWMNWCFAASVAGCIFILALYRERYRRLDIDALQVEVNNDPETSQPEKDCSS